jgi:hypothetical protein
VSLQLFGSFTPRSSSVTRKSAWADQKVFIVTDD